MRCSGFIGRALVLVGIVGLGGGRPALAGADARPAPRPFDPSTARARLATFAPAAASLPGLSLRVDAAAAAAPGWSVARQVGFGMMLAAPLLAGGGLLYGTQAAHAALAQERRQEERCTHMCEPTPEPGRPRRHADLGQWLLLGAGAVTFAGGGALFWLSGSDKKKGAGARVALRVGRDGRPSAIISGKF